jgi:hypothetical protein
MHLNSLSHLVIHIRFIFFMNAEHLYSVIFPVLLFTPSVNYLDIPIILPAIFFFYTPSFLVPLLYMFVFIVPLLYMFVFIVPLLYMFVFIVPLLYMFVFIMPLLYMFVVSKHIESCVFLIFIFQTILLLLLSHLCPFA